MISLQIGEMIYITFDPSRQTWWDFQCKVRDACYELYGRDGCRIASQQIRHLEREILDMLPYTYIVYPWYGNIKVKIGKKFPGSSAFYAKDNNYRHVDVPDVPMMMSEGRCKKIWVENVEDIPKAKEIVKQWIIQDRYKKEEDMDEKYTQSDWIGEDKTKSSEVDLKKLIDMQKTYISTLEEGINLRDKLIERYEKIINLQKERVELLENILNVKDEILDKKEEQIKKLVQMIEDYKALCRGIAGLEDE